MTIAEIHTLFKILTNKVDSLNYPLLEPEEIDVLLNNTQDKLIEQRAYGNNPKRQGVEETQKRVDDLRDITVNYNASTGSFLPQTTANKPHGRFVRLPVDYRHALNEEVTISTVDCTGTSVLKRVRVVPVTHDRYNQIIADPFNAPYDEMVIRLPYQKTTIVNTTIGIFELITDSNSTLVTYHLRYLKTPVRMRYGTTYSTPTTDVQCELAEHIHREIVEEAAREYLENIESPRFQTQQPLIKETE